MRPARAEHHGRQVRPIGTVRAAVAGLITPADVPGEIPRHGERRRRRQDQHGRRAG